MERYNLRELERDRELDDHDESHDHDKSGRGDRERTFEEKACEFRF